MRPEKFCFQYFVGLQKVWLQEGFRGFTKFVKYFSNPTALWIIRLDEWLSLLYVSAQSHSSLELYFLPTLSFNILQVLQGMVGISLPPCPWCSSIALCLRCSCRTCHIKPCGVVICAHLILSLPLDSDGPSQGWADKDHAPISLTSMCHLSIYYHVLIMPGS